MVNLTAGVGAGFALFAWISLIVILATAPEVYDQALRAAGHRRATEVIFLVVLSGFIALLSTGVLRRWRWTFWLILVAFLLGPVRVPWRSSS